MPTTCQKLAGLFENKNFKRASLVFGIIFLVLSVFIVVDPGPFLKFGYFGVFLFNLFGSGTFLIPTLSKYMNLPLLAAATATGNTLNDSVAWLIGRNSQVFVGKPEKLAKIEKSIQRYGLWALFFWSLIPIPYDFIGFVSGYLSISYPRYVIPTFMGKFVRTLLIGSGTLLVLKQI